MGKLYAIAFGGIIVIAWQAVSLSGIFNPGVFPSPYSVFSALLNLAESGELTSDVVASFGRLIVGLVLGCFLGVAAGLATGSIPVLDQAFSPVFNVLRSFPPVALIPFLIVFLGVSDFSKIISIAFAVFFPVWISALEGAKSVAREHLLSARLLTSSKLKILHRVILPSSVPFIISGIRIGIGVAFVMVFVSELAGASSGWAT